MQVLRSRSFAGMVLSCSLTMAIGCQPASEPAAHKGESGHVHDESSDHTHDNGQDHGHEAEGPHHGDLVELGDEEYHAEVVHGEDGVTIYVLDATAKKSVAIDAKEVTLNVSHAGTAEQFKLVAAPDAGDPAGKASRFELKDAELAQDMDREDATIKLSITIGGHAFSAPITHHHHADHHE